MLGVIAGVVKSIHATYVPPPKSPIRDRLDTIDEMVLYGEVTGDSFYGGSDYDQN
jgi:hypothetical protein